jgi:hypothetical protein
MTPWTIFIKSAFQRDLVQTFKTEEGRMHENPGQARECIAEFRSGYPWRRLRTRPGIVSGRSQ